MQSETVRQTDRQTDRDRDRNVKEKKRNEITVKQIVKWEIVKERVTAY